MGGTARSIFALGTYLSSMFVCGYVGALKKQLRKSAFLVEVFLVFFFRDTIYTFRWGLLFKAIDEMFGFK